MVNMKIIVFLIDNYVGCKKKDCKEVKVFGCYVVDGNNNICFWFLVDYKLWLMVEFNDYYFIFLVCIMILKMIFLNEVRIFVGNYNEL